MSGLAHLLEDRFSVSVIAILVLVTIVLVIGSLGRPEVPTFMPTTPAPAEVGAVKDARTVTVDASDPGAWQFFDFSRGSVVGEPGADEWDMAFRRFQMIVNGGRGMAGRGGAQVLEGLAFDSVDVVPTTGYVVAERTDSLNAATERWYSYSFTSHILEPLPSVYAIRTADGKYAKVEILGYYCPGALPGCATIRYVYQGGGGTDVSSN
jgi:hypothetical protein